MSGPRLAYGAFVLAVVLTWTVSGTYAFVVENHPLQWFQAGAYLVLAGAALAHPRLPTSAGALLAFGGVWLAVDERGMVHECLRWAFIEQRPFGARDPIVLAYGVVGLMIAVVLGRALGRRAWPHLAVAGAAAVLVVGTDAYGWATGAGFNRWTSALLEEGGELLAQAAALAALTSTVPPSRLGRRTQNASKRDAAMVVLVLASILWLAWLGARPALCPASLGGDVHRL